MRLMINQYRRLACLALCALALASCSQGLSRAEIKDGYSVYVNASKDLTKIQSAKDDGKTKTQTLSNEEGTFIRTTEGKADASTLTISNTLNGFKPRRPLGVTINGKVTLSKTGNTLTQNGELTFTGQALKKLSFSNVVFEQKADAAGLHFVPKSGLVYANETKIDASYFYLTILEGQSY